MSGERFLKAGQVAHAPRRRAPGAGQCRDCGEPIPRRRKRCVSCATDDARRAAGQRAYYEQNRAKIAAGKRAYREQNRAKIAAGQRAYREQNRAKIAAGQRAYYEQNRAKMRAAYRAAHHCHRCKRPLEPKPGRPPRLCPQCRRKA